MADCCPDYSFAFGLISSVMRLSSATSSWAQQKFSSYAELSYTPQIEAAVKTIIERRSVELFFLFSYEFASKGITSEAFDDVSEALKIDCTTEPFNINKLIWFSTILAYYSTMAVIRGVPNAPIRATYVIMDYLDHYRKTGEFTDDVWHEVEQAAITIAQDP